MTVETEVATLTTAVDNLTTAVNVSKSTLDASVADALGHSGTASTHKTGAETAKSGAESARDQAYTYSQSAASAVAYQDLTAIAESKSDTAVDVFVYDTSKDSDGGQWRKRTQGTSWYNETLNTSTRGSRKEFPSVAVIVADNSSDKLTIYDGDDPSMPMWMVFQVSNGKIGGEGNIQGIAALNSIISIACGGGSGVGYDFYTANLIEDTGYQYNTDDRQRFWADILRRNTLANPSAANDSYVNNDTSMGLASRFCNDVAMTVLPNAPIDPATNLPIPTIAVATDAGVSVIKDDGSVVDITGQAQANSHISFSSNNEIITNRSYRTELAIYAIPSTDINYAAFLRVYYPDNNSTNPADPKVLQGSAPTLALDSAYSGGNGLTLIEENPAAPSKGSVAYITSDYSTGYMVGDIKLAALSDTDDTDVSDANLATNGTMASDTGWSKGTGWSISSGQASCDGSQTGDAKLSQSVSITAGKFYRIKFDWTFSSSDMDVRLGGNVKWSVASSGTYPSGTTVDFIMQAGSSNTELWLNGNQHFAGTIDNVSVTLADQDRSVNGNGLAVHGTIQKNPVATGADLVGYSGFSSSNYLEQPYNSDLDFTDTMSIMFWVKDWTHGQDLMHRGPNGYRNTATSFHFYNDGGYDYRFTLSSNGTTEQSYEIPLVGNLSGWQGVCFTLSSGTVRGYLNGKQEVSGTFAGNIFSQSSAKNGLFIGSNLVSAAFGGSLALMRISATAPSAEQIAKIYEDEKVLFQENAQATLYGSSDAVTALAHDSDTNLLHVGTSSGRSVFSGLKRVDNTTDAVGSCISASNNLVVED